MVQQLTVRDERHLSCYLQGALQEVTDGGVLQVESSGDLRVGGTVAEGDIVLRRYHLHTHKPSVRVEYDITSDT